MTASVGASLLLHAVAFGLVLEGLRASRSSSRTAVIVDLVSDLRAAAPSDDSRRLAPSAPATASAADAGDGRSEPSATADASEALVQRVESLVEETATIRTALADERARVEAREQQDRAARDALIADLASATAARDDARARLAAQHARLTALEEMLAAERRVKDAAVAGQEHARERLMTALQDEIAGKEIAVHGAPDGTALSIIDSVLFPSGQAALTAKGGTLIDRIAEALLEIPDRQIYVEGHTDDVPIGRELESRFASNWELSAARASVVLKRLAARGVQPERLVAVGRADTMPVASNATESGRRLNRRIEIILRPSSSAGEARG